MQDLNEAASVLRAVVPDSNDWFVYDLGYQWRWEEPEPILKWSVSWRHSSEAHGTCTAPTAMDLAATLDATIKQVEALTIRHKPNRYQRKHFQTLLESPGRVRPA